MPVNEDEPIPDPEKSARLQALVGATRGAVGASDRITARVIALFIACATCAALAPIPFNVIGVSAAVLLALDTAKHRR